MVSLHTNYILLRRQQANRRILLDDNNIETGFLIESMTLIPQNNTTTDVVGVVLHTQENGVDIQTSTVFNATRNDQVGFGYSEDTAATPNTFVKVGTLIVRDLFLTNLSNTDVNVELVLTKHNISGAKAIISLLKERSQGELV